MYKHYSTDSDRNPADRLAFIAFRKDGTFAPKLHLPPEQKVISFEGTNDYWLSIVLPNNFHLIEDDKPVTLKAPKREGELYLGVAAKYILHNILQSQDEADLLGIAYSPNLLEVIEILKLFEYRRAFVNHQISAVLSVSNLIG